MGAEFYMIHEGEKQSVFFYWLLQLRGSETVSSKNRRF